MSRFDYVKYDSKSAETQAQFKQAFQILAECIEALPGGRHTSLALNSLEESYMWVGKALRDDQKSRGFYSLQEERTDS